MEVKLVILRHGESIWNLENRFTGWADVPLSKNGINEAKKAAIKLRDLKFDIAFTSELIRAQMTLFEVLNINNNENKFFRIHNINKKRYGKYLQKHPEMNYLKLFISEKLNERDYGDLEGLNKKETALKYGEEQVHIWRRSFDIAPPNGESLKDTYKRTIPYFKKNIEKELKLGNNIIITAHGNSLRSIMKYIEKLSDEEIVKVELPTATPVIYTLNENLKIITKEIL